MAPDNVQIRLVNLTKSFGSFTAVNRINLEIYRGEILGFLGPNGAGKSTTMKMLARLLRPTEGSIYIRAPELYDQDDIKGKDSQENGPVDTDNMIELNDRNKDYLLRNIGFLIEVPYFYRDMTPRQVLDYFARLKGYPRHRIQKRVEEVVEMVGMDKWIDKKFKTFSKGMIQKIGIAQAMVHDPDILVLDEPHSGLDPEARRELRSLLLKLKREHHKTIFISSHLLFEISEIADRVAIISHGHLLACDNIENLEQQAKISQIHLKVLELEQNQSEKSGKDNEINEVPPGLITSIMEKIRDIVRPINGLNMEEQDPHKANFIPPVKYNPDKRQFEIPFNGNPEIQHKILKKLIENDIKITDFSVPRGNLLEDLYMNLIRKSEILYRQNMANQIAIKKVL